MADKILMTTNPFLSMPARSVVGPVHRVTGHIIPSLLERFLFRAFVLDVWDRAILRCWKVHHRLESPHMRSIITTMSAHAWLSLVYQPMMAQLSSLVQLFHVIKWSCLESMRFRPPHRLTIISACLQYLRSNHHLLFIPGRSRFFLFLLFEHHIGQSLVYFKPANLVCHSSATLSVKSSHNKYSTSKVRHYKYSGTWL